MRQHLFDVAAFLALWATMEAYFRLAWWLVPQGLFDVVAPLPDVLHLGALLIALWGFDLVLGMEEPRGGEKS